MVKDMEKRVRIYVSILSQLLQYTLFSPDLTLTYALSFNSFPVVSAQDGDGATRAAGVRTRFNSFPVASATEQGDEFNAVIAAQSFNSFPVASGAAPPGAGEQVRREVSILSQLLPAEAG